MQHHRCFSHIFKGAEKLTVIGNPVVTLVALEGLLLDLIERCKAVEIQPQMQQFTHLDNRTQSGSYILIGPERLVEDNAAVGRRCEGRCLQDRCRVVVQQTLAREDHFTQETDVELVVHLFILMPASFQLQPGVGALIFHIILL